SVSSATFDRRMDPCPATCVELALQRQYETRADGGPISRAVAPEPVCRPPAPRAARWLVHQTDPLPPQAASLQPEGHLCHDSIFPCTLGPSRYTAVLRAPAVTR